MPIQLKLLSQNVHCIIILHIAGPSVPCVDAQGQKKVTLQTENDLKNNASLRIMSVSDKLLRWNALGDGFRVSTLHNSDFQACKALFFRIMSNQCTSPR